MPLVTAGAVELHCEVRGEGPPVLLVMGATGDGGHFAELAEALADGFTVVTYDRRANGRSPRPAGWTTTTAEEQAGDAAALLRALDLAPAAVFGTSTGGIYALALAAGHPELVRGLVVHEPPLLVGLRERGAIGAAVGAPVRQAMAAGGPPAAIEAFWRIVSGGQWEGLDPALRARMCATAETYFGVEQGRLDGFLPDAALAALGGRIAVVTSDGTLPFFAEMAAWLAARAGVDLVRTPGTHTAYHDHPQELARTLRPLLERLSAGA